MDKRFWARLRTGRTSRLFSAYLAVVLLTAIVGPGLAVYGAEGETTATAPPDAPVVEAPPVDEVPEAGDPEVPPADDPVEADVGVPEAGDGAIAAAGVDVAAIVDPDEYDGNPPLEDGCYRTEDPTTTTYYYGDVSVDVTVYETNDGWALDFDSTAPVTKVTVKGGPDANIYTYDPGVMSDEGLHAPALVSNGLWPNISHVDFCFGEVVTPETGSLVVRKFEDLDENGLWDMGEPVLEGWDFTAYDAEGVQLGTGTTDANGWLMWEGLPEGEVTVVETLKEGWSNTTPLTQSIMVVAGDSVTLRFGNVRMVAPPETGDVLVHKFEDYDHDGVWDEGEPMLADWHFRVFDLEGVQLLDGYTDDEGMVLFEGLPEGDVIVRETLQEGWYNTSDQSQMVAVVAGETAHVYFGNVRCPVSETGSLVIRKFEDLDEDGMWDEGEPVLGGWFFTLYDAEGVEIDNGFTDENGWLMFEGLAEGEVTAVETLAEGWTNTTPLTQSAIIVGGGTAFLRFGNMREVVPPETGNLVVRKFEDLDEDGVWDEGEPVLGGWDFTAYDAEGVQLGTGTTDANGWLMWEGLPEGEVTVVETLEAGWTNTTPLTQSIMIVGGETAYLYFGNVSEVPVPDTGDVVIYKFLDDNENGIWDVGEQFLPGWSFVVRDAGGTIVASGSTSSTGDLMFDLPVGTYTVTETLASGWTNTTAITQSFTIVVGQTQRVFFGNAQVFLPFTPSAGPAPSQPFLPFTGGEYLTLIAAALASSVAGVVLRRKSRR